MSAAGNKTIKPKVRTPKCSRCQYHGIVRELKGHKRFCPFQNCVCNKCGLNVARRKIMAAQLALKHHEQEMELLQTQNTSNAVSLSTSESLMGMPGTSASPSSTFLHNMVLQHRQNDQHYAMQQLQNHFIQGAGRNPSESLLRMPSSNTSSNFPLPNMVLQHRQNDSRYSHTVHHRMMLEEKNMQPQDKRMSQHLLPTTVPALPPYHSHSSGYF